MTTMQDAFHVAGYKTLADRLDTMMDEAIRGAGTASGYEERRGRAVTLFVSSLLKEEDSKLVWQLFTQWHNVVVHGLHAKRERQIAAERRQRSTEPTRARAPLGGNQDAGDSTKQADMAKSDLMLSSAAGVSRGIPALPPRSSMRPSEAAIDERQKADRRQQILNMIDGLARVPISEQTTDEVERMAPPRVGRVGRFVELILDACHHANYHSTIGDFFTTQKQIDELWNRAGEMGNA